MKAAENEIEVSETNELTYGCLVSFFHIQFQHCDKL